MSHPILLYDGVCALCNRIVRVILSRDTNGIFQFASLQSPLATRVLARHGASPSELDTFYVVLNCDPVNLNEREEKLADELLSRSDAVSFVLIELGGIRRLMGRTLRRIPRPIRDWAYRLVARHRYRIFGRYETCPMPTEATRDRFLDL